MAQVNAILIVIILILVVIAITVVLAVYVNRKTTNVTSTSTPTIKSCTSPPITPIGVTVTNTQGDLLAVTWDLLANTDSYTVYLGISPGFSTSNAITTNRTTNASTSFGNLSVGVTYYVKLSATNSCGTSLLSSEVSVYVPYNFPTAFTINYNQNNSLETCFRDDPYGFTYRESASAFCDANASNVSYRAADQTIRLASDSTRCLTRIGTGNQIWMNTCVVDANQTWTYNNVDLSMCDPANPTTKCMLINNVSAYFGDLTWGPKSGPATSGWNILAI